MGSVIELKAKPSRLDKVPVALWSLRWRIVTDSGLQITSAFLPETKYPSIESTLREFAGRIESVFIDGRHMYEKQASTFLRCPGDVFASLSYKALHNAISGRQATIGIEVEDVEGTRYLVLRDGTVYVEERKAEYVANDH